MQTFSSGMVRLWSLAVLETVKDCRPVVDNVPSVEGPFLRRRCTGIALADPFCGRHSGG